MAAALGGQANGALELTTSPGLADFYRQVAESSTSPTEREAAEKFVLAEGRLDAEDVDGCLQAAQQAVDSFLGLKHKTGVADSLRLMVQAHRMRADVLRCGDAEEAKGVRETLQTAEQLGKQHIAAFHEAGDKRSEAIMMLAVAEVNYNKRGGKKRREAMELLAQARVLAQQSSDNLAEASVVFVQANAAVKNRLNDEALAFAEEAQSLYRAAGDRRGEGKALHMLALARIMSEDFEEGMKTAEDALSIFRELKLKRLEAFELFIMAHYWLTRKKGREAVPLAEDALELFKEVDSTNSGWTSHAYDCLVQAYVTKGDAKKAMIIAQEACEHFELKKDKRGQVMALSTLATALVAKDDCEEAVRVVEQAQAVVQEIGDKRWEAGILQELASIHMLRESYEEASMAANDAVAIYQDLKDRQGEAMGMNTLAQVALAKNDLDKAVQIAQEQRAIFQEIGDKVKEAACLLTVSTVYGSEEKYDDAMAVAREAQEISVEAKDRSGEARALNVIADLLCDQKDFEGAAEAAKEMRAKLRETGDKAAEVGAIRVLANIHLAADAAGEAVRAANEALALAKKVHDKKSVAENMLLVSEANLQLVIQDNPKALAKGSEKSLRPAKEAYNVAKSIGHGPLMGSAMYQVANVQLMTARLDEALAAAREAVDIFRQVDERIQEAAAVLLIADIHHQGGAEEKALDAANEGLMLAKACGDEKKMKQAEELIEKIAGRRVMYTMGPMDGHAAAAPGGASAEAAAPQAASVAVAPKEVGLDPLMVEATVQEMARAAIGVDDELFLDSALMDSGMDSLTAVSFRNGLQQNLGVKLPSSLMFDYPTMKEVSNRIIELSIENAAK
ncbi:unnamed protein product [Polarella glacialis]|uniref:Carrier domain-containing protein n=1 Tax=Polarella glacialis TaxID=89957 RepID=A0A813G457_POLGL|nr:unnamed protein product [Polarella glacialis]